MSDPSSPPTKPRPAPPLAKSAAHPRRPTPRATTNVDLGPLKPAVASASAAAGQRPSDWIRAAIQARLNAAELTDAADAADAADAPAPPEPDAATERHAYRAWLDARKTAKLDQLVQLSGRRSRSAVLGALIEGVDLGIADVIGGNDGNDGNSNATLADATQALTRSNHELVACGRNLNQVAKSLNTYPGKTTVADRMAIEQAAKAVQAHLPRAARLVADLLPLVTPRPVSQDDGHRRASAPKRALASITKASKATSAKTGRKDRAT